MKKTLIIVLLILLIFNFASCKDSSLMSYTYHKDYNTLIENLDHAEIVRLPSNASDKSVIVRTFSYDESLVVIKEFCEIEYTMHYLSLLTTPKWVYGTCLRIISTDGEYTDYGVTDGAFGQCKNEEFEGFISKYTE